MPLRADPVSLPRAPDVAPALVGLVVAAATVADRDAGDVEPEVADDSSGDDAAVRVLVVGVEEEEGTILLLAAGVALMLRLTPTPTQICCAKAMTSAKRGFSWSVRSLEGAFHAGFSFGAMSAPCTNFFPPWTSEIGGCWRRKCYAKKGKTKGGGRKYTLVKSSGGHCCSAPASALLMKVLSLHRHLKSLDWQPVEPMAERAGLCCGGRSVSFGSFFLSRNARESAY